MNNGDKSEIVAQFEAIIQGGNARGQRTRMEIIERAAKMFSEVGFHGSSLRAIARSSGVDHSTLKHHFGTKEDLLTAVLRWRDLHGLHEWAETEVDRQSSAETIAQLMGEQAGRNRQDAVLTQLYSVLSAEAGTDGHPAREYLQERQRAFVDILEGTIRAKADVERLARSRLSPREIAVLLSCAWDGMQVYDALNPGDIDVSKMVEVVAGLILGAETSGGAPGESDHFEAPPTGKSPKV